MKKGLIIGLGVLIVAVIVIFFFINTSSSSVVIGDSSAKTVNSNSNSQAASNSNSQSVKTFDLVAKNWEFSPSNVVVSEGDKVVLNVMSIDVEHGFYLPDFSINQKLMPNNNVKVEFTADKKGTFTFKCNVPCGSGHKEMTGTLVVN